jgi:hypothetical protein
MASLVGVVSNREHVYHANIRAYILLSLCSSVSLFKRKFKTEIQRDRAGMRGSFYLHLKSLSLYSFPLFEKSPA